MKTFFRLVVALLIMVLLLELFLILNSRYDFSKYLNLPSFLSKTQSIPTPTQIPKSSPLLAPDWLQWEQVQAGDLQSIAYNLKAYLFTDEGENIPNLPMKGREWVSVQEFKTAKERAETRDVISFYMERLADDGWRNDILIQDSTVKAIIADGPTGSIIGMGKLTKTDLQIIVISYEKDTKTICPCKETYRVFLLDPFPESLVLENIKV